MGGLVPRCWGLEPGLCCEDVPIWRVGTITALTHVAHIRGCAHVNVSLFNLTNDICKY